MENIMGLDMYLHAEKYVGGGWRHVRESEEPCFVQERENFDKVLGILGFESYESMIEKFPEASSAEVSLRVGYWRKANVIHNWFVKNVQGGVDNCEKFYVSTEQLTELKDTCQKILDTSELGEPHTEKSAYGDGEYVSYPNAKVDEKLAETLLPTSSGFFFGDTSYGEWYIGDLQNTVNQITSILESHLLNDCSFYYQSSW